MSTIKPSVDIALEVTLPIQIPVKNFQQGQAQSVCKPAGKVLAPAQS